MAYFMSDKEIRKIRETSTATKPRMGDDRKIDFSRHQCDRQQMRLKTEDK